MMLKISHSLATATCSHTGFKVKLFYILFFGILLTPSVSEAQCTTSSGSADVRVTTGSTDDATQLVVSPYTMTTGGSGLALMTTANFVGLRFPTINIPQGATITGAYIEFTASATASTAASPITIYGFDTTSTVGFTATARDIRNRGLTGQTTSWTPGNWTSGTAYQTNSLVAIVQQIVNRGDWVANNNMGFIFESTAGTNTRTAHSIESSTAITQDPRLVVTWQLNAAITTTANVSGCFDSNGNTAGGTNQTILQVIVDWKNRPGTQDIVLKVQGQPDFTIDPDVVTKPFVKNYTLTADATTKTVDANFSTTTTCTATQKTVTLPAGSCLLTPCQTGNTGGQVWRDFNSNGIKDASETVGISGVTVKAYDCNGVLLGTTTTDYQGQYTFSSFTPSVSNKVRLEFSTIPLPYLASAAGANNGTTTQFVSATGCSYHLGVNAPSDYCQTNPLMATNSYVNGNNSTGTSGAADVLVKFSYDNTGLTPTPSHLGFASEAGTTWGLAYQKETKKLFSTAYLKRHAGFGPSGTGGIYVSDITAGTTTNFINLNGLGGISTGTDPHTDLVGDNSLQSRDSASFHVVGKIAFGDMDISDDGKYLFAVNLNTRQIHKIFINNPAVVPTAANITTYTIPNPCGSSDNRPFALKYYKDKLYVGVTCTAESSQSPNDLSASVYEMNPTTGVFSTNPVISFPLTYTRGQVWTNLPTTSNKWYPWLTNWNNAIKDLSQSVILYPQPMLTDIEFDVDGSMLLGFRDRMGDQLARRNLMPDGTFPNLVNTAGGDILRAYPGGTTGKWIMESAGLAGSLTGNTTNGEGFGGGEFYSGDDFVPSGAFGHKEISNGGLALLAGSGEVAMTAVDPRPSSVGSVGYNSAGVRFMSNTNGTMTDGYQIYDRDDAGSGGTFAKSSGLGDLEVLCNTQPIEIGNYVWLDTDGDGVQDPCETPLSNVTVALYKGTTKIASTTTNANGNYYFSSKYKLGAAWTGTGIDTGLIASTAYKIVFGETQYSGSQLTLSGSEYVLTNLNNNATNNGNDQNDSDASEMSIGGGTYPSISVTTPASGSEHSFDAGFKPFVVDCCANILTNGGFETGTFNSTTTFGGYPAMTTATLSLPEWVAFDPDGYWFESGSNKRLWLPEPSLGTGHNNCARYNPPIPRSGCWIDGHVYQVCLKVAAYNPSNAAGGTTTFISEMESPQRTLNETVLTTNGSTNNSLTNLNWQSVCFNFTFNAGDDKFFISVKERTSGSSTIGVVFDDVVITDKTVCTQPTVTTTANVSGCFDSNGNTAGGTSQATVQVIVDWTDAPSGENIILKVQGQANVTINPATATKPFIQTYTLTADASTKTIDANYSVSTTVVATQKTVTLPAGNCIQTPCVTGNTGGTVWRDYNNNGIKDASETLGISGITVKAYDCNSTLLGTTTTDNLGQYTFSTFTPSVSNKIRLEFSGIPSLYKASGSGSGNGTDVRFISATGCAYNFGINNPSDYCQTNPQYVLPSYVNGTTTGTAANDAGIIATLYNSTGLNAAYADFNGTQGTGPIARIDALISQVGSVWGEAYHQTQKHIYFGTFLKRHVGMADGPGYIYNFDYSGTTPSYTGKFNLQGATPNNGGATIDLGTVCRSAACASSGTGITADYVLSTNKALPNIDLDAFGKIGTMSFGDLEMQPQTDYLWAVNLYQKALIRVNVSSNPTALPTDVAQYVLSSLTGYPTSTTGILRPWALKFNDGKGYLGVVNDATISGLQADLRAYVLQFDPNNINAGFTQVLNFDPNIKKDPDPVQAPVKFQKWLNTYSVPPVNVYPLSGKDYAFYPQAILSGIEFDGSNNMYLSFLDRLGHQLGYDNYTPLSQTTAFLRTWTFGELLKACTTNNTWSIEGTNGCQLGTEFFQDIMGDGNPESSEGSLAILKSGNQIMNVSIDPHPQGVTGTPYYATQGPVTYNLGTGAIDNWYSVYYGNNPLFGKANGLGDLELVCNTQPLEIGNYVWLDQNKDGVQDPCEPPLSNITVELWKNNVKIASTPTTSTGNYYFSSKSNLATPANWLGTGADTTLRASMAYELKVYKKQPKLADTTALTTANATANNGNDINDSDAFMRGDSAIISLTTPSVGSDHTLDFGFQPACTAPLIGSTAFTAATCTSGVASNNAVLFVRGITGGAKYRYGTNGTTGLFANTATSLGTADSVKLTGVTNPSVSTTYTFRIYAADTTCFNDTTLILYPATCAPCHENVVYICGLEKPRDAPAFDHGMITYLQAIGYTVQPAQAVAGGLQDPTTGALLTKTGGVPQTVNDFDKIVVSHSAKNELNANTGSIVTALTNTTKPVLMMTRNGTDVMGMATTIGLINSVGNIWIEDNTSSILPTGLANGSLNVYNNPTLVSPDGYAKSLNWARGLGSGAIIGAYLTDYPADDKVTYYGYPKGSVLANGSNAAGRRFFIGFKIDGGSSYEPEMNVADPTNFFTAFGKKMIDAALFNTCPCVTPCTAPLITSTKADTATCTNGVMASNAKIAVRGITGGAKYSYGTNGTTGLFANTATTLTADSIKLTGITNPSLSTTYTFRIYAADTLCYNDTTVVLPVAVCPICNIAATFTQGSCQNNNTTAITTDDYFTVVVSNVLSTNGGTSGRYEVILNGTTVLNTGGTAYGTSVTVGGAGVFSSNGTTTYNLKVRDLNISGCETTIFTTSASANCSTIPCPAQICVPVTVSRN